MTILSGRRKWALASLPISDTPKVGESAESKMVSGSIWCIGIACCWTVFALMQQQRKQADNLAVLLERRSAVAGLR